MNHKYLSALQVFILVVQFASTNPVTEATDFARVGLKLIKAITETDAEIKNHESQRKIQVLLEKFTESSQRIESNIRTEAQRIIDELSVEINMQRVNSFKVAVDEIYLRYKQDFHKYVIKDTTYEKETIERFVNDRDVFKQLVRSVQYHTVPSNVVPGVKDDRLFEVLGDYLKREAKGSCAIKTSPYKILYETYNTAVSAVVRGTLMISYSYKLLQERNNDAWKSELEDVEKDYIQTVSSISSAARAVMARSSRAVIHCDPKTYVRGVNYMNYLFRSLYITSSDIWALAQKHYTHPWPRSEVFCHGTISNCVSTRVVRGCMAPPESGRRYEVIIERGGILDFKHYYKGPVIDENDKNQCSRPDPMIEALIPVDNLACICDEPYTLKTNAFHSKTAVFSDIANNRIITGIRFRTRWAITYLEIQAGEIVNGTVIQESVHWNDEVTRRLEDYERKQYVLHDDVGLKKSNNYIPIPDDLIEPDFDLVNLRHSDVKFNLDDVVLPSGMVVTGVKFLRLHNGGLSLMIAGSRAFDDNGNFKLSSEIRWFSSGNYYKRNPLNLDSCDNPLRGAKQNKELSTPGHSSVAFRLTDWSRDGSQSLIPFVDLQELTTDPPSPIGGIGIFYKGQKPYGGFLSLKIIDMDETIFMFSGGCNNETL